MCVLVRIPINSEGKRSMHTILSFPLPPPPQKGNSKKDLKFECKK